MPARATENQNGAIPNGAHRWRINSSGQVVNLEAEAASWELADEIGRLKIGDVTGDTNDVRVAIRTPPKSKLATTAVNQLNEASPLDSSSNTSVGSSPHVPDHPISHSRGSSADTTNSRDSGAGNTARLAHPPLKIAPESKERPHSFSGGLSSADLRRLQQTSESDPYQQQWSQNHRDANPEQLTYPSLTNQVHRPVPQQPMFNYPPHIQSIDSDRDDAQFDYNNAQRPFNGIGHPHNHASAMNSPPQFVQGRPTNGLVAPNYRQSPRTFPPGPTPSNGGYGAAPGHHTHLSLGNSQQLYDMMLPGPSLDTHHPAVTRVQQQHNVFRATHHHSASNPSALRDAATLALLNSNNMQPFAPNMFQASLPPPMPLYNQYYGATTDLATQQAIAARIQAQYTSPYGVVSGATATPPLDNPLGSPTSSNGQSGPSANNRKLGLYKTELCRSWEEKGSCRYGAKCQFAHGEDELRKVSRHPKYKTEICKTFWVSGSCPYGKRCCFIHTELSSVATPASTGTSENTPTQTQQDGRDRSNSDPDTSSSVSLLARISQRSQEQANNNVAATPVDMSSNNSFQFTRPPTGSLRVDTSALDGPSVSKQNKSAYPSFASNGILLPAPEPIPTKSPAPVTAGPDLGRHNLARMEIVGFPSHQKKNSTSSISNSRHSLNGSEGDLSFSPSPPATGHSYGLSSTENAPNGRVNGHVRGGSAGNWGSFSRSSLSNSTSAFSHGPSQAGEIMSNSPWSSTELAVGSSRIHEKAWA